MGIHLTTYNKKNWNANQRLVHYDVLIESSFDIDTVMDFDEKLKDKTSALYAETKQQLLNLFLEEYTQGPD